MGAERILRTREACLSRQVRRRRRMRSGCTPGHESDTEYQSDEKVGASFHGGRLGEAVDRRGLGVFDK
jgi:hypothetical protein